MPATLQHYKTLFADRLAETKRTEPSWLISHRQQALNRFLEIGLPTREMESWHATPIGDWVNLPYSLAEPDSAAVTLAEILPHVLGADKIAWAVLVDGVYREDLSQLNLLPKGVFIAGFKEALASHDSTIQKALGRQASEATPFGSLNDAFSSDGLFVLIPKGVHASVPLQVICLSTESEKSMTLPRLMVIAEAGSSLTLVEHYLGRNGSRSVTNAVTTLQAAENAKIDHYKLEEENADAIHLNHLQTHHDRYGNISSHSLVLGSSFCRYDISSLLDGEGAETDFRGLFLGGDKQIIDHHIRIDHLKPHGTSNQEFRGVLDGASKGIFNGTVVVHQGAKKTVAYQQIKNLLLSRQAEAIPEPMLKILDDDVKCSHGATVGQLDSQAIFYLRSRGLSLDEARSLLTYAFCSDLIGRFSLDTVKSHLLKSVIAKLPKSDVLKTMP